MAYKGTIPWNKGKKCPSISVAAKKRPMLVAGWNRGLPKEKQPGYGVKRDYHLEKHPNWKGGKRICKRFGYVFIRCKNHPRSVEGYVREHRLVMEKFFGRYLTKEERVHHRMETNKIIGLRILSYLKTKVNIKNIIKRRWRFKWLK